MTKRKASFPIGTALIFDPDYPEYYSEHPLCKGQIVYFISDIPNVPGHCIVATEFGKVVPMVHPDEFRLATEDEL